MNKQLLEIQNRLKAPKSQYNSFGKYSYRSCEDILEAVKPLLIEQKAQLTLSDEVVAVANRIYIKATATFTTEEETIVSTAFAREPEVKKGMDESQITGTASSYARKYALNGLFLIDDEKDADYLKGKDKDNTETQATNETKQKVINTLLATKKADGSFVFTAEEKKNFSKWQSQHTPDEAVKFLEQKIAERKGDAFPEDIPYDEKPLSAEEVAGANASFDVKQMAG